MVSLAHKTFKAGGSRGRADPDGQRDRRRLVACGSQRSNAQLQVSAMTLSLADLQSAPFNADPAAGGSARAIEVRIDADERSIARGLTPALQMGVPLGSLSSGRAELATIRPVVASVYRIALQPGGLAGRSLRCEADRRGGRPDRARPAMQIEDDVRTVIASDLEVDDGDPVETPG